MSHANTEYPGCVKALQRSTVHSGEKNTEDNLTDMVGGYTALEGRWSRGRQV